MQDLVELVEKQSEDEGLWVQAETAPEVYLQQALRDLHDAIEGYDALLAITAQKKKLEEISGLSAREAKVLRMRFGQHRVLQEIARHYGTTYKNIHRVEKTALNKLRMVHFTIEFE